MSPAWQTALADLRNTALAIAAFLILNFLFVTIIRLATRRGDQQ